MHKLGILFKHPCHQSPAEFAITDEVLTSNMIRSNFDPVQYTGAPGEQVNIATHATNNSENLRVVFTLDGAHAGKGPNATFFFSDTPGAKRIFSVSFFGATGESCGVGVSNVPASPGGVDRHALVVTNSVPVPTHVYEFLTKAGGPESAAAKKAAKRVARKSAAKKAAKKAAKGAK